MALIVGAAKAVSADETESVETERGEGWARESRLLGVVPAE